MSKETTLSNDTQRLYKKINEILDYQFSFEDVPKYALKQNIATDVKNLIELEVLIKFKELESKLQAVKDSLMSDKEIDDMRPSSEDLIDHAFNVGKRIGIQTQRERTKKAIG